MKKAQALYDVYLDGVCVLVNATAKDVGAFTGYSDPYIRKCARKKKEMGGKYTILPVRSAGRGDREYTEEEARRKFGYRNYEKWRAMNARYGGKN